VYIAIFFENTKVNVHKGLSAFIVKTIRVFKSEPNFYCYLWYLSHKTRLWQGLYHKCMYLYVDIYRQMGV